MTNANEQALPRMAALYPDLFLQAVVRQTYQTDGIVTFIVQHDVDSLLAWCLLASRLQGRCSTRTCAIVVQTRKDLSFVVQRLTLSTGPIIILGIDYDLADLVRASPALIANESTVFHITRTSGVIDGMKDDLNDENSFPDDLLGQPQRRAGVSGGGRASRVSYHRSIYPRPLKLFPFTTAWIAIALIGPLQESQGLDRLVAVAAAGRYQAGHMILRDYRDAIRALDNEPFRWTGNDSDAVEQKHRSIVKENRFPGLFFHCMTLEENFDMSLVVLRALFNLPADARGTEIKNVRVSFGLDTEHWTTAVFHELTPKKQVAASKHLATLRFAGLDFGAIASRVPIIEFKTRGHRAAMDLSSRTLTNLDLGFVFLQALGGSQVEPFLTPNRDSDLLSSMPSYSNLTEALSVRVQRMTASAHRFNEVYEAFNGLLRTSQAVGLTALPHPLQERAVTDALTTYRRLCLRGSGILKLLVDHKNQTPEKSASAVFQASPRLLVAYLTATGFPHLTQRDASTFLAMLSQSLSISQSVELPSVLMIQAGVQWSVVSLRRGPSDDAWTEKCHQAFRDVALPFSAVNPDQLDRTSHVFNVPVPSDVVWQHFATTFRPRIRQMHQGATRKTKRRKM